MKSARQRTGLWHPSGVPQATCSGPVLRCRMSFDQKVWELMKRIPQGKVTTYKIIAEQLNTRAYRAVGNACHRNPYAPVVPCHRVVKTDGSLGGYAGGIAQKRQRLQKEGIPIRDTSIDKLDKVLYKFRS